MKFKYLLLLFLIFSFCNCGDDELQLQRMDYAGTQLRLDGYYYDEFQSDVPRYDVYFLYSNGVILHGNSIAVSNLLEEEELYSNGTFHDFAINNKDLWGVYKILGNEIEFERWYPSGPPLETFVRAGTIIDEQTFHITRSFRPDGSDERERDEIYKFKAFRPKPDSTNMFIH